MKSTCHMCILCIYIIWCVYTYILYIIIYIYMGMDQYLYIPFLGGWTSIYQLFWCSPGVQGFDTLPYDNFHSETHGLPYVSCFPSCAIARVASIAPGPSVNCTMHGRWRHWAMWHAVPWWSQGKHCEHTITMVIYIYIYMILYDYMWFYMIIYDYIWLYMIIFDYVWLYMIIYDFIWLYMILYDCMWFYIIIMIFLHYYAYYDYYAY
jgi:hypothetical protein